MSALARKPSVKPALPPDPEGMNSQRSYWAECALDAFQAETRTENGDKLCDLLGDLMHWCDRNGTDFNHELDRAVMHYTEETEA